MRKPVVMKQKEMEYNTQLRNDCKVTKRELLRYSLFLFDKILVAMLMLSFKEQGRIHGQKVACFLAGAVLRKPHGKCRKK